MSGYSDSESATQTSFRVPGITGPTGPGSEKLSTRPRKPGTTDTLEDVRHDELFNLAVRWERLRRRPHWTWVAPLGYALLGAGIGALASGSEKDSTGVVVCVLVGVVLLTCSRMIDLQRIESLDDLCDDFMRYIDGWACDEPDHATNSAHARHIASQSRGTKTFVGFGLRRFVSRRRAGP